MIDYDSNRPLDTLRLEGSNIPRAALFTIPSVLLAIGAHYALDNYPSGLEFMKSLSLSQMWSASIVVLSILIGMRTSAAYARFWEGITLVQLVRAEWFEAVSNLVAFSLVASKRKDASNKMQNDVAEFQFTLVRLMSLMHGAALKQIGGNEEEFRVLDIQAIDADSLAYLASCQTTGVNPVEVLIHWIQVLVTDSFEVGIVCVPAPILTRVYQTLSRGMVNLHDARKLADVPFPFPFTQMVFVLLLLQCIFTPIFFATALDHPVLAAVMTFVPIFGMFTITFTAGELEHPFGDDANDLNLSRLQDDYNKSLLMLLDRETARAPGVDKNSVQNVEELRTKYCHSRNSSMTHSLAKSSCSLARALGSMVALDDIENLSPPPNPVERQFSGVKEPDPPDDWDSGFQADTAELLLKPEVNIAIQAESKVVEESLDPPQEKLGLNVEQKIVQSLAEECVGALTQAISELLHKAVSNKNHKLCINLESMSAPGTSLEELCANLQDDPYPERTRECFLENGSVLESGTTVFDSGPTQSSSSTSKRFISLGEETCRRQGLAVSTTNRGYHRANREHGSAFGLHHTTPRLPSPPPSPPGLEPKWLKGGHHDSQFFVF